MKSVQMVDLKSQYERIKPEIDRSLLDCIASAGFINGPEVKCFQASLEKYLDVANVIPCANGTDALQLAIMALGLKPGDEVIVPAFTYAATVEVIALLALKPVMADVDPDTFNIEAGAIEALITEKTRAIVPVHLFGQSCDMESIMKIARKYDLSVIEDNAQAIAADYTFGDGEKKKTGSIGHVGCTSFFPSKNLGCFGDGGAVFTQDSALAEQIRMIANHGQKKKYYHSVVGVNSRLDSIQAAVLNVKIKYLDEYTAARQRAATFYDHSLGDIAGLQIPRRVSNSTHVFHQYTLKIKNDKRDGLQAFLRANGIPSMIYYPLPLYHQEAFREFVARDFVLPVTEELCSAVLSLPIHTEMTDDSTKLVSNCIRSFFGEKLL